MKTFTESKRVQAFLAWCFSVWRLLREEEAGRGGGWSLEGQGSGGMWLGCAE